VAGGGQTSEGECRARDLREIDTWQAGSEPVKKMKKKVWRDWGKDEESDYFGLWQTELFEPVEAVDVSVIA
jgi:hypothetical protein